MTLRSLPVLFTAVFLLTGCSTKRDNPDLTVPAFPLAKQPAKNPFVGKWMHKNTIWYNAELTLEHNGTFYFYTAACMGKTLSQGHWTNEKGTLVLTSFDSFREPQMNSVRPSEITSSKKTKLKKDSRKITFDPTILHLEKSTDPMLIDTLRIYFDKVRLTLVGDSLYFRSRNIFPDGVKFYKQKDI